MNSESRGQPQFDHPVPGDMLILDDYWWAGVYRPQKPAEDP